MARKSSLGLAVQALALQHAYPGAVVQLRPGGLLWRGVVQPTALTYTYTIELRARQGKPPAVRVLSPDLVPDNQGRLPHVYDNGSLCVSSFPNWRPSMLFTHTFLPWTCEWLAFYEIWRATRTWHGDGPDCLDPVSQTRILHTYR